MRRYSTPKRMRAKFAGTCVNCGNPINIGADILYASQRAWHHNCATAGYEADNCTNCSGSGLLWNNVPCRACDGTGTKKAQEFASLTNEQRHPVPTLAEQKQDQQDRFDMDYEDACRDRCGL